MARTKDKKNPDLEPEDVKGLIAKKDWHILSGSWDRVTGKMEFDFKIREGQSISDIPERFHSALKAEGVI